MNKSMHFYADAEAVKERLVSRGLTGQFAEVVTLSLRVSYSGGNFEKYLNFDWRGPVNEARITSDETRPGKEELALVEDTALRVILLANTFKDNEIPDNFEITGCPEQYVEGMARIYRAYRKWQQEQFAPAQPDAVADVEEVVPAKAECDLALQPPMSLEEQEHRAWVLAQAKELETTAA